MEHSIALDIEKNYHRDSEGKNNRHDTAGIVIRDNFADFSLTHMWWMDFVTFHFYFVIDEIHVSKHFAASHLGLFCLPMSCKKGATTQAYLGWRLARQLQGVLAHRICFNGEFIISILYPPVCFSEKVVHLFWKYGFTKWSVVPLFPTL